MSPDEKKAYRTIAKHIFEAHRLYEGSKTVIILANNWDEAKEKAHEVFSQKNVFVKRVLPTDDASVYEI